MKQLLFTALLISMTGPASQADDAFTVLTREHTDIRILHHPGLTPALSIVARDEDRGLNRATNEVILVGMESSKLTLPSGTPFGNGGAPFWILPQSQNPKLLYLGVSAEGLSPETFEGGIGLRLKHLEGPGYMMVWQSTGPGQFAIRINTRDGIDVSDSFNTITGSHEHFNWGFSAPGLYRVTLQAEAQAKGGGQILRSLESTFLFQIRPLPPATRFEEWQLQHWPPGFDPEEIGRDANRDQDVFTNLQEYAFGLSPTTLDPAALAPELEVIPSEGIMDVTLHFRRNRNAQDLTYEVQTSSNPAGPWSALEGEISSEETDTPGIERVTLKDQDAAASQARFYRLQLRPRE